MEDNYLGVAENVDLLGGMMHDFHRNIHPDCVEF